MQCTKANIERLKRENDALKRIVDLTFWMARRYANGRHTYAPGMVRDAWDIIVRHPEWGLTDAMRYDDVVWSDTERDRRPDGTLPGLDGDYLADCMDAVQPDCPKCHGLLLVMDANSMLCRQCGTAVTRG